MTPTKQKQNIPVTDLSFAAFLKAKYRSEMVDVHLDGNRVSFVFDLSGLDFKKILTEFNSDSATINPKDFASELRGLKSIIAQVKSGGAK